MKADYWRTFVQYKETRPNRHKIEFQIRVILRLLIRWQLEEQKVLVDTEGFEVSARNPSSHTMIYFWLVPVSPA